MGECVNGLGGSGHTLALPSAKSIMLPNEEFALGCRAWYEEQGLIVDKTNGQFAHCPQPERYGDKGYYLLWGHHQHQGLLQSKDVGERCFFPADAKKWLSECEYWPDNYFDLWDIYEKYSSELSRKNAEKLHSEKNENGKSIHAVKTGTTSFCNKTGIHDPLYRNSAEYKIINTLAGEKGGQEGARRRSGIHDPNYRSSGTYLEMRSEVGKKMAERRVGMFDPEFKQKLSQKLSKPVTFHYPDGQTVTFPSRMEAIRQTKISSSTLVRVLLSGKVIQSGRFKGVRVTEANG